MQKQAKLKRCTTYFCTDKFLISLLLTTTLLSGSILASTYVKADNDPNANSATNAVVDDITIMVPTACTLSGTISSGNEHNATILPGSYTENIGKTDLKALCNDFNGFSIYAVGYSNNASGVPEEGNNIMVGTNTHATINTGTATSGNTSAWAMKLTKVENPSTGDPITYSPDILTITTNYNNAYYNVPDTLTKVVEYKDSNNNNSSATDQTLGAHIETTYAAYVASTQPSDTYNGKVKYLLVHPANLTAGTYDIVYYLNGGTGTMYGDVEIPNYEPYTLTANTYTAPSGYVFAGWCTEQDQTQNPQTTCTGTSYNDKATIPASTVNANETLRLYAYWKLPPTMQSVATWKDELNIGDEITVMDSRDNKLYTAAKLADGNIWMTQNLDLDLTAGDEFTHSDTDLGWTEGSIDPNASWTVGNGYTTITKDPSTGNFTGWTLDNSSPRSADPGDMYYYTSNTTSADIEFTSLEQCKNANYTEAECRHYKVGNYYNWTAAIATNDSSSFTGSDNAPNSICPAGWRLPKAPNDSTNEFGILLTLYNVISSATSTSYKTTPDSFNTLRSSPLYFVRSGYIFGSSGVLSDATVSGDYWSSTAHNASDATSLYLRSSDVRPASNDYRSFGWSLRCLAR